MTQHEEHDPSTCEDCMRRMEMRRDCMAALLRWRGRGQYEADKLGSAQVAFVFEQLCAIETTLRTQSALARVHGNEHAATRTDELADAIDEISDILMFLRDPADIAITLDPLPQYDRPADAVTRMTPGQRVTVDENGVITTEPLPDDHDPEKLA